MAESGDDNAIVGLAIDRTTVQIQLIDPKDDAGEEKLPPSPVLICVTLEGKLSFFSFARLVLRPLNQQRGYFRLSALPISEDLDFYVENHTLA